MGHNPIQRFRVSLQVVQQGDALFQIVDGLPVHGLLASIGSIRQRAVKSQAKMVGRGRNGRPDRTLNPRQILRARRWSHRRTVVASGERVASWQSGAACSMAMPEAIR
jgi:hypothetical protein